jgi:hypothetical protein
VVSTAWNDNNGENSHPIFYDYVLRAVAAADAERAERASRR